MKFFNRTPEIKASFGMTIDGSGYEDLAVLQQLYPIVPATDSDRSWHKSMKTRTESGGPTMKFCPGVYDFSNAGYIVPCLWDMRFYVNGEDKGISWEIPKGIPPRWIMTHEKEQLDSCPIAHGKNTGNDIVKVTTPWYWETPKGWSTIVTKPFYNYSNDFDVCPGIIDSDLDNMSNHLINVFLRFNTVDKEITFRAGQPLCQLIPFKRQKMKLTLGDEPDEKGKRIIRQGLAKRYSRFADNPEITGKTLLKFRDPTTKKYE